MCSCYNGGQRDRLPWRGIMRGIRVVVCGFVLASVVVSLAALSAGAQTAAPEEAGSTGSSSDGLGPSQGSFTDGRAGPDEPSLVDDTPPSDPEGDQEAATARGRASGNAVVRAARRHIGTRYGYATCSRSRMSCTCLTKKAWARFGHKLSMSEGGQWKYGRARSVAKSDLRPGDIVFFKEGGKRRGITQGSVIPLGDIMRRSSPDL